MRSHRHYFPSSSNSSPHTCSPLSVFTSPFIPIFQSFFPHFSDLPPAASVYVRLRFVYEFQFNFLRAQIICKLNRFSQAKAAS